MVEKGETGRGRESESHGSKSGGWGEDQSVCENNPTCITSVVAGNCVLSAAGVLL